MGKPLNLSLCFMLVVSACKENDEFPWLWVAAAYVLSQPTPKVSLSAPIRFPIANKVSVRFHINSHQKTHSTQPGSVQNSISLIRLRSWLSVTCTVAAVQCGG